MIRQEVKKGSRRDQLCVIIHHDDFKMPNGEFIELHTVKCYFKVTEEGDPDQFFDDPGESQHDNEAPPVPFPEVVGDALNGQSDEMNTLEALCGVVEIDDDNEPAPENIPQRTDNTGTVLESEWGHDGFCFR